MGISHKNEKSEWQPQTESILEAGANLMNQS